MESYRRRIKFANDMQRRLLVMVTSEGRSLFVLRGISETHTFCKINICISFEVMLPSACSFIVDGLTFSCLETTTKAVKQVPSGI
jgi:hypothetical protein